MARGRKKKEPYFGEDQEMAVIKYGKCQTIEEKNYLFEKFLKKPFQIMIESIIRKYPVYLGNYDISEVEKYALSHLIENMIKYNPNKVLKSGNEPKAFSYCQTIVRNFFKDHSKKNRIDTLVNLNFEDYFDEVEKIDEYVYEIDSDVKNFYEELMTNIIKSINKEINENKDLKKNELAVGYAIINVLENWHVLFQEEEPENICYKKTTNKYAKNKILLLLKEQTRLQTKDIRTSMKQFKSIYCNERNLLLEF